MQGFQIQQSYMLLKILSITMTILILSRLIIYCYAMNM